MQTINLHIYKQSIVPVLFAKQGDVGRKFKAVLTDGTAGYTIPANTVFSVWFSGASGEGNYSAINGRSAFTISGNTVEVELITQMLNNKGQGVLCLVMNNTDGTQIGTWNIPYEVEAVPGMGSAAAQQHFTALSEVAAAAAGSAARAEEAAKKLTIDDTLSKTGQAADANAVGEKVKETNNRVTATETEIIAINDRATAVETEIENLKTGMKPTLLWSNKDPVAIFASQDVEVPNGADYPMWLVVFRHTNNYGYTQESLCRVSAQGFVYFPAYSVGSNNLSETYRMYSRRADRTGVTFYDGYVNGAVANYGAVPVQIWGLKI